MEELMKVIVFELNKQQYGVDIQQVRSIEKLQEVTEVPRTSEFIKGVINLRGKITPIIDLKERLQINVTGNTSETRAVIVNINDIQVGLIVDSATDVIDIDCKEVEPSPRIISDVNDNFIKGVAKLESRLLILLDLELVLNFEELNEIQQVVVEE